MRPHEHRLDFTGPPPSSPQLEIPKSVVAAVITGLLALVPQAKAQVADQDNNIWFGTIRPPLNPPTGQVVDRIAVGDNFSGMA
jgi:hypothetical protein